MRVVNFRYVMPVLLFGALGQLCGGNEHGSRDG